MRKFTTREAFQRRRAQREFERALRSASPAMQQELLAAASRSLPR
jgi:hypothetical protein